MPEITHLHTLVGGAIVFSGLGAWLGPKLRAWWFGIPASVQATVKTVEASLVARLKSEEAAVVNSFHTANGLPTLDAVHKAPEPVAHHPV